MSDEKIPGTGSASLPVEPTFHADGIGAERRATAWLKTEGLDDSASLVSSLAAFVRGVNLRAYDLGWHGAVLAVLTDETYERMCREARGLPRPSAAPQHDGGEHPNAAAQADYWKVRALHAENLAGGYKAQLVEVLTSGDNKRPDDVWPSFPTLARKLREYAEDAVTFGPILAQVLCNAAAVLEAEDSSPCASDPVRDARAENADDLAGAEQNYGVSCSRAADSRSPVPVPSEAQERLRSLSAIVSCGAATIAAAAPSLR